MESLGTLSKVQVKHRKDNLLGESAERHKNDPHPTEAQQAHRTLFAFVEALQQAGELTLAELKRRVSNWPQFLLDNDYRLTDRFWLNLVLDEQQMIIRTEDGGLGGPFCCAIVEEVLEYPESADDLWAPPHG